MAPRMPKRIRVMCPENEALSRFFLQKWRSMTNEPDGLSDKQSLAFSNASRSIAVAQEHIRTLDDFRNIKGIGPWLTFHMKEFFPESSQDLSPAKADVAGGNVKGKKTSGRKPYLPQKNSAAYAILITLLWKKINGKDFMPKQELIDAAEASGLSRDAIGPNKYKAKQSYGKDWYTGWSCMKTLISKELVSKWSSPAKYMLTEKGEITARDCVSRSELGNAEGPLVIPSVGNTSAGPSVAETVSRPIMTIRRSLTSVARHSPKLVVVCDGSPMKEQSSNKSHVHTKYSAEEIISCDSDSDEPHRKDSLMKGNGSSELIVLQKDSSYMSNVLLAMPPSQSNENFLEAYEVVLILDDREKFGSRSRNVADNIRAQINLDVPVEIKHLPVGDGIWIARHRKDGTEYVLDYIVERKNVSDLNDSIVDNRYKEQKLRLQKCGLQKLIYLIEGDPKCRDVSEKVKTACITTEILDGFDIQRTTGYADTERLYARLTCLIVEYYNTNFSNPANTSDVCLTYKEFERRCKNFGKTTVSQIFALQLMQVPQVSEEAALAVIELYPTLISLARAYSMLGGDTRTQEEMLQKKSEKVNAAASRNIFKLVWAEAEAEAEG